MKQLRTLIAAASIGAMSLVSNAAFAGNKETVENFYNFLSNPESAEAKSTFMESAADDWASIGDYSGKSKNKEAFAGQVSGFFAKLMPDLNWEIQDMHEDGDTVIVRSRATGTPTGPLFGVDGEGRSFDILAIDIHHLEDGKIKTSYHVEDWSGALQQLSGR